MSFVDSNKIKILKNQTYLTNVSYINRKCHKHIICRLPHLILETESGNNSFLNVEYVLESMTLSKEIPRIYFHLLVSIHLMSCVNRSH